MVPMGLVLLADLFGASKTRAKPQSAILARLRLPFSSTLRDLMSPAKTGASCSEAPCSEFSQCVASETGCSRVAQGRRSFSQIASLSDTVLALLLTLLTLTGRCLPCMTLWLCR